jgi:GlpG protein
MPKTLDVKVFADYLLTLGMKTRLDEQGESWNVWIYNEDHLDRARSELQSYLTRPEDPRYRAAVEAAETIRRQEHQLDKQFRKNYREVADLWAYPGVRRRPLTVALVVACLIVFVFHESRNRSLVEHRLMFSPSYVDKEGREVNTGLKDIQRGEVWRLVSPILLHFGILHLMFNMWVLTSFGTLIEIRRGTLRLAGLVLAAAVASNLGQYIYMERADPGAAQLFGGMSGVICALFGYIWMKGQYEPEQGMVMHPHNVTFVLLYLALCMTGAMGPIANAAHFVGLATGVVFGVLRY